MKTNFSIKSKVVRYFIYLQLLVFLAGCSKKNDSVPSNSYLVDYKLVSTISVSNSLANLNILSIIYPEVTLLKSSVKFEVNVYTVTYKTHYKSEEIIASGLICVPNSNLEFPMISFQNGTNTINENAPTVNPNNSSFKLLQSFAGNGYIIIIPDYIGFGASNQYLHPYYMKEPTNNAIIDLIHAANEFILSAPIKAKFNSHYYLMGYSQGGWATLSAFSQIENGNEAIVVNAASCGAGAYNLINTSDYIVHQETFPGPLYLPYYIYSHQKYGTITDSLGIFFNEPYSSRIPSLFDGMHNSGEIDSQLNDTVSKLITPGLMASLDTSNNTNNIYNALKSDLAANSVLAWQLKGLLHFYHGNIDDNVPVSESRNIYHEFFKLNSSEKVEYFEMDGLNHETGVIPWGIKTLIWFNSLENSN
jgi:pimeloyl-ACP methyl ester carboxylesterase